MERRKWKPVHVDIFKYSSVTPKSEQNWLKVKFIFSLVTLSLKFIKYLFGRKKLSRGVISLLLRL